MKRLSSGKKEKKCSPNTRNSNSTFHRTNVTKQSNTTISREVVNPFSSTATSNKIQAGIEN